MSRSPKPGNNSIQITYASLYWANKDPKRRSPVVRFLVRRYVYITDQFLDEGASYLAVNSNL